MPYMALYLNYGNVLLYSVKYNCFIVFSDYVPVFVRDLEIWGAAFQNKYVVRYRIDRFLKRAFQLGYTCNLYTISH